MEVLRMPSEDHSPICFDANDYRVLRIEEFRLSAAAAAEKVKRPAAVPSSIPMNSRERRIIHLALRNETDVRSESRAASGGYRQVVVDPAGHGTACLNRSAAALVCAATVRPGGGRRGRSGGGSRRPWQDAARDRSARGLAATPAS